VPRRRLCEDRDYFSKGIYNKVLQRGKNPSSRKRMRNLRLVGKLSYRLRKRLLPIPAKEGARRETLRGPLPPILSQKDRISPREKERMRGRALEREKKKKTRFREEAKRSNLAKREEGTPRREDLPPAKKKKKRRSSSREIRIHDSTEEVVEHHGRGKQKGKLILTRQTGDLLAGEKMYFYACGRTSLKRFSNLLWRFWASPNLPSKRVNSPENFFLGRHKPFWDTSLVTLKGRIPLHDPRKDSFPRGVEGGDHCLRGRKKRRRAEGGHATISARPRQPKKAGRTASTT